MPSAQAICDADDNPAATEILRGKASSESNFAGTELPILTVRLDDWVTDFDATLACCSPMSACHRSAACTRFYEADSRVHTVSRSQVRQPVNARGLGRWKAYAPDLKPLIDELDRAGALQGWCETERGDR